MTIANRAIPFGLRDVKLTPLGADGATPGSPVDLPVSRTLSFSETEEFEELRGDDAVQASHGSGPTVEWELESGGISLEAYAVMAGGTVTTTGVSPNEVKRYKKNIVDVRPYFRIEGQAINDNGGDFHGIIYRAKADGSLEGSMEDGSFWISSASGKGYGALDAGADYAIGDVYDFVHNETAVGIPEDNNEVQMLVVDATGGTYTLTYSGQTTAAIAYDAAASALLAALEALSNIGVGDVAVVLVQAGVYKITFQGALADTDVGQLTTDPTNLTGGSSTASVYTAHAGG
jgi:hypothetical protein